MELVNKKSHQAQIKVKSNDGNKAISSEVSQQKVQGQQHKQPNSQQQQQHSQKQQQLPVSQQQQNKKPKKPVIMIAGDSIAKGQKGWLMSREKMVKVHSFSGATTDDMDFFLKPLLNREPDHLILHTGTNDLRGQNPEEIAKRIRLLAEQIYQKGITCTVSLLLTRSDDEDLDMKVKQVNDILFRTLPSAIKVIEHNNISHHHLNKSGLHLNRRGDAALARNFIGYIRNYKN